MYGKEIPFSIAQNDFPVKPEHIWSFLSFNEDIFIIFGSSPKKLVVIAGFKGSSGQGFK